MRVLAIRLQAMGDVVITLPYLNSLKNRLPGAELDLLTREETAGIPRSLDLFSRIFAIGGGRSFKRQCLSTALLLPRLLARSYDAVLDLQNSEISRSVTKVLRPERRSLFDRTSPMPAGERTRIAVEAAGLGPVSLDTALPLRNGGRVSNLLRESGWLPEDRLVVLNPAGAFPSRNWPLTSYVRFARTLRSSTHGG
jgi:ADP-heptose:LPS heptosyltransferase